MQMLESSVVEFDLAKQTFKNIHVHDLNSPMVKDKIYWIHVNYTTKSFLKKIAHKLHLSADLMELIEEKDVTPMLIETVDSLTLRIQCLTSAKLHKSKPLKCGNLIVHITNQYCLTLTSYPIPALQTFSDNYHKTLQYARTPGFVLFLVMDEIISDYSNILFEFELAYDNIDFNNHSNEDNLYANVMFKKKQLIKVTRHVIALRGILMRISGRKISVISEACRVSLSNLLDHEQLIIGEANAIRDMLNGTLDQIDNALMHDLNETMKVLTAFSAIFLPLTLVAGIYGMNFSWMPELHWRYGYFFSLFIMVFIAVILVVIFKKKKMF